MIGQSNNRQGRGHDRLPNWNPKNGEMLISQPVTGCLTNHSELCICHARAITNHVGFRFIDFCGGHLSVSSLRCLQLRWQVVTLWLWPAAAVAAAAAAAGVSRAWWLWRACDEDAGRSDTLQSHMTPWWWPARQLVYTPHRIHCTHRSRIRILRIFFIFKI